MSPQEEESIVLLNWESEKKSVLRTRESQQVPIFSSLQACNINISSFSVKYLIIVSLGSSGIVCTAYSRVQRQETVGRFGALLKGEAENVPSFLWKKMIACQVMLQRTRLRSWQWLGYHSFWKRQGATTKTTGYQRRACGSKATLLMQKSVTTATWFCRPLSYQYTEEGGILCTSFIWEQQFRLPGRNGQLWPERRQNLTGLIPCCSL